MLSDVVINESRGSWCFSPSSPKVLLNKENCIKYQILCKEYHVNFKFSFGSIKLQIFQVMQLDLNSFLTSTIKYQTYIEKCNLKLLRMQISSTTYVITFYYS